MKKTFFSTYILFLFGALFSISPLYAQVKKTNMTVTLDAGHGGKDPGALGSVAREKHLTLSIIKKIGNLIETEHPDVKVVYTRNTDCYLTLQERANIANKAHSDLFISVHVNANNNKNVFGCETYTLGLTKSQSNLDVAMRENSVILLEDEYNKKYEGFDPKSVDSYIMFELQQNQFVDKSISLASTIQQNFVALGRKDRGVRQAGFWVLHKTSMPSVLVEVGYISNLAEEKYLNTEKAQNELARAIYDAFVLFKHDFYKKSGIIIAPKVDSVAIKKAQEDSIRLAKEIKEKQEARAAQAAKEALAAKRAEEKRIEQETIKAKKDSLKRIEEEKKELERQKNLQKQKEEEARKKAEQQTKTEATTQSLKGKIEYRVQLFALSKKLSLTDPIFKGLKVSYYNENGLYKYTYGSELTYEAIRLVQKEIESKFSSTMIVRLKDGQRIK